MLDGTPCKQGMPCDKNAATLALLLKTQIPCSLAPSSRHEDKAMKNYMDGGEAILEAFRKLKIDYILSSPGSEWSPVWEALVRQKIGNRAGPAYIDCWHETLAVNMATGYTLMTGRPQAVLVHAGVGLLQGSHGRARRAAVGSPDDRDVGRVATRSARIRRCRSSSNGTAA